MAILSPAPSRPASRFDPPTSHPARRRPGRSPAAPFSLVRRALSGLIFAIGIAPALAQAAAQPKVMIVIDEKISGMFGTTGSETIGQAESTMANKFRSAGFQVIDAQTVRRNISRDKALRILDGDDKAAALAGLQFGAQVVVTGQAISKNAGGKLLGTNMQSLQATVQAHAVWSDDARVIASLTAQSSKAHIDEMQGGVLAIREASEEVADGLVMALLQESAKQQVGGRPQEITVIITGLVSYRHLSFVQQFLESNVQGVKGVNMRQFAQGTAELTLDYMGKSSLIARDLASQKFTGFRLEPVSVTPNRLDIRAVIER
jgi:hypothetical protein